MPQFSRYAVYDLGPQRLAECGARWLGWDAVAGQELAPMGPAHWTDTPRKYGFHATIKAPFRLATSATEQQVIEAFAALAATLPPVDLPRLSLVNLDGFLALIPQPQPAALTALAQRVVEALDEFRAPLSEADIARRNPASLDPIQRSNLERWGYPYVGDQFHYHMTLTGRLSAEDTTAAEAALAAELDAMLQAHPLNELALMGEDANGRFHLIQRAALSG